MPALITRNTNLTTRARTLSTGRSVPQIFRNDGTYCGKPKAYDRGAGCPWKWGDKALSLVAVPEMTMTPAFATRSAKQALREWALCVGVNAPRDSPITG